MRTTKKAQGQGTFPELSSNVADKDYEQGYQDRGQDDKAKSEQALDKAVRHRDRHTEQLRGRRSQHRETFGKG
jgi:hypothetical protein